MFPCHPTHHLNFTLPCLLATGMQNPRLHTMFRCCLHSAQWHGGYQCPCSQRTLLITQPQIENGLFQFYDTVHGLTLLLIKHVCYIAFSLQYIFIQLFVCFLTKGMLLQTGIVNWLDSSKYFMSQELEYIFISLFIPSLCHS